jgi:DNA-binding MarR family transcriptional regulator
MERSMSSGAKANGLSSASPRGALSEHLVADLLTQVHRDGRRSQRQLATEMGVALGLVNAYVKRCVKKGLIKVSEAPARRYVYYLTPGGFAEKSRLTAEYLSRSFLFFRLARRESGELLDVIAGNGWRSVGLVGLSELTEIAILSALERGIAVRCVVDATASLTRIVGVPVVATPDVIEDPVDAWMITALGDAQNLYDETRARWNEERVFAPSFLGLANTPPPARPIA